MTSLTEPPGRRLAEFTIPSTPGNERFALARVAEAVKGLGLTTARVERLKTAVAEATMNAIEHGNRNRPEVPVEISVTLQAGAIVVSITNQGSDLSLGVAEEPDLQRKLDGSQTPRGWGLFLIRNLVDRMDVTDHGTLHTVRLTMNTTTANEGDSREEPV